MAKSKKSPAKRAAPKKKPAKSAKAAGKPARARKPGVVLTKKERQLLKPRTDFESLIKDALTKWAETPKLRVPGVTRGSLKALLHKSERTEAKEKKIQERFDKLLGPLADARRIAQSDAYAALLMLHKAAKLHGQIDPAVASRFEFITTALRSAAPAAPPADAASAVVQKATKKAARATKAAVAEAVASAAAPPDVTNGG